MQEEVTNGNFSCTENDGLIFDPNGSPDSVLGSCVNTCYPTETDMPHWTSVSVNWTRSTSIDDPEYHAVISLLGLNSDGKEELIGEIVKTDISDELTETLTFDLKNSAGYPPLVPISGTAPTGKIQVNLPFRAEHFESLSLTKNWMDETWTKRQPIVFTNNVGSYLNTQVQEINISYDADMQSDFEDVRFIDGDGITPLNALLNYKTDEDGASYDVQLLTVPIGGETIYYYYGNSDAGPIPNVPEIFKFYNDFEDGLTTGWSNHGGTLAVESSTPIEGEYSLKHTGNGSIDYNNVAVFSQTNSAYVAKFDFQLKTQGTATYTPWINLFVCRYENVDNRLVVDTFWNSGTSKQRLRLQKVESGTVTNIATVDWLSSKLSTSNLYHFRIKDNGSSIVVYINGVSTLSTSYSSTVAVGNKGVGANLNSSGLWDRVRVADLKGGLLSPVSGTLTTEEINDLISADTYLDDDLTVYFTPPSDWPPNTYSSVAYNEYENAVYETGDYPLSLLSKAKMGYNSLDAYSALRIKIEIVANSDYETTINQITYNYEVTS